MKTFSAKSEAVQRRWLLIDAAAKGKDGKVKPLGRLATEIARRLRGKHKPEYTPHVDTGDYIVVLNASDIFVTGQKTNDKIYYRHSGYPGGLKEEAFKDLHKRKPERVLELAVKGMLPKNPLGRAMFRKLKIYADAVHPHTAQQPELLEI